MKLFYSFNERPNEYACLLISFLAIGNVNTNIYVQATDRKPILREWGKHYIEPSEVNHTTRSPSLDLKQAVVASTTSSAIATISCIFIVQG